MHSYKLSCVPRYHKMNKTASPTSRHLPLMHKGQDLRRSAVFGRGGAQHIARPNVQNIPLVFSLRWAISPTLTLPHRDSSLLWPFPHHLATRGSLAVPSPEEENPSKVRLQNAEGEENLEILRSVWKETEHQQERDTGALVMVINEHRYYQCTAGLRLYAGMTQPVLLQRLWSWYILYTEDENLTRKSTDPMTKAKSHVGTDCKCRNHPEEILWLDGRKQTTTKNNDSPISSHFGRDLKALEERSRQNTYAGLTNWKDQ